jgi:hypothetical protein
MAEGFECAFAEVGVKELVDAGEVERAVGEGVPEALGFGVGQTSAKRWRALASE